MQSADIHDLLYYLKPRLKVQKVKAECQKTCQTDEEKRSFQNCSAHFCTDVLAVEH